MDNKEIKQNEEPLNELLGYVEKHKYEKLLTDQELENQIEQTKNGIKSQQTKLGKLEFEKLIRDAEKNYERKPLFEKKFFAKENEGFKDIKYITKVNAVYDNDEIECDYIRLCYTNYIVSEIYSIDKSTDCYVKLKDYHQVGVEEWNKVIDDMVNYTRNQMFATDIEGGIKTENNEH